MPVAVCTTAGSDGRGGTAAFGSLPPRPQATASNTLQAKGYKVEWHTYPMGHSVVWEEIEALGTFLARLLG